MTEAHLMIGDFTFPHDVDTVAQKLATGEAVAIDNDFVFALWGDGRSPHFKKRVEELKGSDANKPFGLTIANSQFCEYIDRDRLAKVTWPLFEAKDLTDRTGAFVFWRLPGRQTAMDSLPSTVWSIGKDGLPIVQNWSPEGKPGIERLLAMAGLYGIGVPSVTSLNKTKEPEIVSVVEAVTFARRHSVAILHDTQARRLMSGSYPVIQGDLEGLHLVRGRPRALGHLVLSRLLDGYTLDWPQTADVNPGWDSPELADYRGTALRSKIIEMAGWVK